MAATYTNPIMPGFAPDPTLIHVDGTYYLSNSSFHVFPGLPIYASKNLKSWTQIGKQLTSEDAVVAHEN
jgi:beta-xylosidase